VWFGRRSRPVQASLKSLSPVPVANRKAPMTIPTLDQSIADYGELGAAALARMELIGRETEIAAKP
jgi:hypothetical protein